MESLTCLLANHFSKSIIIHHKLECNFSHLEDVLGTFQQRIWARIAQWSADEWKYGLWFVCTLIIKFWFKKHRGTARIKSPKYQAKNSLYFSLPELKVRLFGLVFMLEINSGIINVLLTPCFEYSGQQYDIFANNSKIPKLSLKMRKMFDTRIVRDHV